MSGVMTCAQCGQEIVGAIVTRPEPNIYGTRMTTVPEVIEAHNSRCVDLDAIEARLTAARDDEGITWHERQVAIWDLLGNEGDVPALVAEVRRLRAELSAPIPTGTEHSLRWLHRDDMDSSRIFDSPPPPIAGA